MGSTSIHTKKGGDTKISIDDKTLIGPNEP